MEPFARILAEEGYEVSMWVRDATGAIPSDAVGDVSMALVDLSLGFEAVRVLSGTLFGANPIIPPLLAVIGLPKSYEDIDAMISIGVNMYVEDDIEVFKKRVRFLRGTLKVRSRAAALMNEVRESELKYKAVISALEEGLLVQQPDGTVTATNPAAGRILGLSDDELRARRWRQEDWEIVDQGGHRVPLDAMPSLRALRTGEPVRGCVLGLRRPDGSRVWISSNSHPLKHDGPDPVAVVTTFSDVTARRRLEEQFLDVLQNSPDAVLLHRKGTTIWANQKWADLLGYDEPKSLVGMSILDFVSPRFKAFVAERVDQATRGHVSNPSTEQGLLHRDGSEVLAVVHGMPTLYFGEPVRAAFARDISEQRRLEMQLMAADRLATLGRLAAGVGHEINNPLAYVLGNVQLAVERLRSGDGAEAMERLEEALDGAERIRLIVKDLKVFGAHVPESLSPVDVHRVVDSCARIAESEIRLRATLVRDFGEVPMVMASEPRLAQVVLNLMVNAIQSIPDDRSTHHTITVSTRLDPDGRVALRISDTGVGIEPENLSRVMEPFFTTKADKGGTGLGLSICNMLVADQGGQIEVESQLGRGTTVTVRLRTVAKGEAGISDSIQ
jgi:PAS domain S-box-containing protein